MKSTSFDKFAGVTAILAGIAILIYAIAFVVISRSAPALGTQISSLCLVLNGLLAMPSMIALYFRLRQADEPFALFALFLGMAGALGALVHGGYDLANAINPPPGQTPEIATALGNLPNQLDPRGLLTFGVSSIAIFTFTWLMGQTKSFPTGLRYLGILLAVLLLWLYIGRLVILDATNPLLLIPILLTGFVVNPAWYIWLGIVLRRESQAMPLENKSTRMRLPTRA
jgi:hypothetical protein